MTACKNSCQSLRNDVVLTAYCLFYLIDNSFSCTAHVNIPQVFCNIEYTVWEFIHTLKMRDFCVMYRRRAGSFSVCTRFSIFARARKTRLNIFRRFFAKNVEENVENRENPTFSAVLFPKMLRKMLRRFSLHYKYGVSGRNSEL